MFGQAIKFNALLPLPVAFGAHMPMGNELAENRHSLPQCTAFAKPA